MPTEDQLNQVYDLGTNNVPGGPGPKVVPKSAPTFDIANLDKNRSPIELGGARSTDVQDYGKYLDQGVYSDQDIDTERAQHQGILNKIGHGLANLPGNIIGSFMEGIGDMGLLSGQWGDDRTYTNGLIEAGKKLHDLTGQVYEGKHDGIGATLSDPGWWVNQASGLAEFAISYAALGAGVAGTMSKLAEGTAGLIRAGEATNRGLQMMGQLGTAGFMSYTMGAQSAGQVFKDTYETQFNKMINAGMNPDEAKTNATHIAAQSAATTAQLTTAIGTTLALTSMGAYFRKPEDVAMNILRKEVPQVAGETTEQWAARVKSLNPANYDSIIAQKHSLLSKFTEMGKMGIEMQQLQFGQKTGEELGKQGKTKGLLDQFSELSDYFDRTMDKDGALAFGIGAISGLAIDHLRNNVIPSRFADKIDPVTGQPIPKVDNDGNVVGNEQKLYTPKVLSERQSALKFTTLRDAIGSDIDQYGKLQQSYLAAVKSGDPTAIERSSSELFNANNITAITTGMKDVWKQTYNSIASMSPQEALQRGYTSDPNDTSFQDKAKKASENLDRYQDIYDTLQKKYGTLYEVNQGYKPVVDGLFSRKVNLDTWDQMLKEHESKITELNKDENFRLELANPDLYSQNEIQYNRDLDTAVKASKKLQVDHKLITTLIDQYNDAIKKGESVNNIVQKMSIVAREYSSLDPESNNSANSLNKSMNDTVEKIEQAINKHKDKVKQNEDNLFNSSGYNKWLERNLGKSFQDYMDRINQSIVHSDYQSQVEVARDKYNIAKRNIAEIEGEKNLSRLASKYDKYIQEEAKKVEDLEKRHNEELANRTKDSSTFDKARKEQMNEMGKRYKDMRDKHIKEVSDNKERLNEVNKEIDRTSNIKDIVRKVGLRNQKRILEKQIAASNEKIKKYDSLYNQHHVDTSTNTNPITTNDVTINPPNQPGTVIPPHIDPINTAFDNLSDQIEVTNPDLNKLADNEAERATNEVEVRQLPLVEAEKNIIDKLSDYMDIPQVMEAMQHVQDQILNNQGFSFDLLNNQVALGLISKDDANNILLAAKEYAEALRNDYNLGDMSGYSAGIATTIDDGPEPAYDAITTDPPSDPPIITYEPFPNNSIFEIQEDDGNGSITFGGAKTIEANTIANSTLGYWEFAPDHNKEVNLVSQKDAINQKTNPDVLKTGKLTPGTKIRFVIDTEYDGPANIVGSLKQDEYGKVPQGRETFADYSDEHGKVPAEKMANVPIKIVDDKSGKTIGYVRKHQWVTERYGSGSDKTGLRNIAEKYDEEGNEYNGAKQSKNILDIRKAIVDRFNASKEDTHGNTTTKGVGHPILNMKVNINSEKSKAEPGYAFNRTNPEKGLLPDPKLKITISDNGTLKSGKGYPFDKSIAASTENIPNGHVMVMLPGANGQHIPAPLVGKSLGENDSAHRTVSRALELYLQYTGSEEEQATHEINTLRDKTGHDVSSESGLRNFINQYFTYLQRFDDTATIGTGTRNKFLFNVWDKIQGKEGKAWIKAGWENSNEKPVYASLDENGKLDEQFSNTLKEGLNSRSKAVVFSREGIRGINEPRDINNPFVDALYRSDGKWQHNTYNDYNEFVKSFSRTTAYGRNKLSDGTHVYTANPSIEYQLDTDHLGKDFSPTLVESNNKSTSVNIHDVDKTKSLADEMDDIFEGLSNKEVRVKEIGTGGDKSKPLNLKNLEDLFNFTPEDQRNGKVPSDILKELTERGHGFIPEGYNPFTLCL